MVLFRDHLQGMPPQVFSLDVIMVTSWLLNVVSKEIVDNLLYLDSAHAFWSDLCDQFHQSSAPLIFQIKQQVHGLSQGSLDVYTYYTWLKIFGMSSNISSPLMFVNVQI